MNLSAWQYYIKFYRGSYRTLLLSVIISAGQCLLVLPIAFLVRYAFDKIIPAGDIRLLVLAGIAILLLNLANSGITLLTRYLTLRTTKIAIRVLRDELLNRCYNFSRSYYSETDRSKLHAIIVGDTQRLDVMSNALVALLLPSLVISIALCGVLIFLNWFLFLVMTIAVPFLILVSRLMKKGVKERVNAYYRSFENFSKGILFVLQMMDLTRIQTAEKFETERQRKHFEELRVTSGSMAWLNAAYTSVQYSIAIVSGILILVIGGMAVASGSMSLGALLAFYVAVSMLNSNLKIVISSIPQIIAGKESLDTLFNIVRTQDPPSYSGHKQIKFSGNITLASVNFQYKERQILQDINLTIKPKTMVAIAGPNGVGKSTIAYLVMGFYRPLSGQLYADDHPYHTLDIIHLRQSIGFVMQDPIIFPGTILENITYGRQDASLQEIISASELATSHEFIQEFPQGYNTITGENGMLLSGGQRQRIAIARALLRQPKFLILDEPSNHLDEAAARQLMINLKRLNDITAILIISNDINIIRETQYTYFLQEGGHVILSENSLNDSSGLYIPGSMLNKVK
jgi:ATP-binding cassette subfamily B protein